MISLQSPRVSKRMACAHFPFHLVLCFLPPGGTANVCHYFSLANEIYALARAHIELKNVKRGQVLLGSYLAVTDYFMV